MRGRPALRPFGLLSLVMVTGCLPSPDTTPRLTTVTVTCAPASVALGKSAQCRAGLKITPDSVGSIPADTVLTANTVDAVIVYTGAVWRSQTWPKLGAPYRLSSSGGRYLDASVTTDFTRPEYGNTFIHGSREAQCRITP